MVKDKRYVDRALGNPYPVEYFDNGETNILGLYSTSAPIRKAIIQPVNEENLHLSVIEYSWKIINALIDQRTMYAVKNSSDHCKNIKLACEICDILGYTITIDDKAQMLVEGFNEGQAFLTALRINPDSVAKNTGRDNPIYRYPRYYMSELDDINGEAEPSEALSNLSEPS